MAYIQRSRGYSLRPSLSIEVIAKICEAVRSVNPDCVIFTDNCYGELVEEKEPVSVGADLIAAVLSRISAAESRRPAATSRAGQTSWSCARSG